MFVHRVLKYLALMRSNNVLKVIFVIRVYFQSVALAAQLLANRWLDMQTINVSVVDILIDGPTHLLAVAQQPMHFILLI